MMTAKAGISPGHHFLQIAFLALLVVVPTAFALITWHFPIMHTASIPILGGEILMILVLGLSFLETDGAVRPPEGWNLAAGLLLIATGVAGAVLNAPFPGDSLLFLFRTVAHIALAALLFQALAAHWRDFAKPIVHAVLFGALFQIAFSYFVIAHGALTGEIEWKIFMAGASNVRQLSFIGIVVAGISAGLAARSPGGKHFLVCCLGVVIGLTFLDLNGGRAGIVAGLGAVGLAALLSAPDKRLRNAFSFLACFAASVPLSMIYVPPNDSWGFLRTIKTLFGSNELGVSSPGRTLLWGIAYERFLDHPFVGNGEGQFRFFYQAGQVRFNHPHNVIVQSLFQWGAIGTICAAFLFARPFLRIRAAIRTSPEVAIPAFCAVAGLSAMAVLDGSLYYTYPTMTSVVLVVLIAVSAESRNRTASCSVIRADDASVA
ncbi:O-antigen ligase family protein [Altererythrobacter sp.]|uniref:O-antigen ligase family protein n=1 Tax=Altererythrobacter sp. TaxID=1872480 RepID=UPI003D0EAFB5